MDDEKKCEISNGLVFYFDIYGFSSLVSKNESPNNLVVSILDIWDFIKINIVPKRNCIPYLFSDCGFLFYPHSDNFEKTEFLTDIFDDIKEILHAYLKKNFFLRGAIAYGDIHYTNNLILGDAVVRAVKYESEYCPGPFIMFPTKECYDFFKYDEHFIKLFHEDVIILKHRDQLMESLIILPADKKLYLDQIESKISEYSRNGPHNYANFWFQSREFLLKHIESLNNKK
ncbi:MAG: hypothetical protein AB1521_03660 [Bacteroidota bacterium]